MKKYSIEDLRNGKCAVCLAGSNEKELSIFFEKVNEKYLYENKGFVYFSKNNWIYSNTSPNLPIQFVKHFLIEEEFSYGDVVNYKGNITEYFFIALLPNNNSKCVITYNNSSYVVDLKSICKVIPPLELTLKEVAEKFGVEQVKIIE